ncbi:MAG: hypothetical protein AAGA99_11735 [Actinomycetota bacterium]
MTTAAFVDTDEAAAGGSVEGWMQHAERATQQPFGLREVSSGANGLLHHDTADRDQTGGDHTNVHVGGVTPDTSRDPLGQVRFVACVPVSHLLQQRRGRAHQLEPGHIVRLRDLGSSLRQDRLDQGIDQRDTRVVSMERADEIVHRVLAREEDDGCFRREVTEVRPRIDAGSTGDVLGRDGVIATVLEQIESA